MNGPHPVRRRLARHEEASLENHAVHVTTQAADCGVPLVRLVAGVPLDAQ